MVLVEVVYLDLDGVLANFCGGVARDAGVPEESLDCWELWTKLNMTEIEFWDWLNSRPAQWWADLEPYPWAMDLYGFFLELGPVCFATSPSKSAASYAGKYQWLCDHFGAKAAGHSLMGHAKHWLAAPNRVLIDDADKNVDAFREYGGRAVLFPRPWNRNRQHADNPMIKAMFDLGWIACTT